MIKAIVVAANFHQYATYIRNRGLNRAEYGYYGGNEPSKLYGLSHDLPVLMLEGWSENKNFTPNDLECIKHRFKDIRTVSEGWIYNEGFKF